jgi:hypothetical protein
MARQYKRDARGRFASGGSSGRRAGGTLAARASLRSSRKKLAAKDSADGSLKGTLSKRAQKAAVTKGSKRLKEAKKAATVRIAGRRGGTVGRPKGYVRPVGAKQGKAKPSVPKVDLTDAGFTRRLRRAQRNLSDAQKTIKARGGLSEYDYRGKARLGRLQSAVDSLKFARTTVRRNTVTNIKSTDKVLIENYNRQLAATKRRAASTPSGGRRTTAPRLTPSQKAAATRERNKAARAEENRRRWEQARRYG